MRKFIGAHVSTAGGIDQAPLRAKELGADAFALFTKNQRQWLARPLEPATYGAFKVHCAAAGIAADYILPHDSYLINLGHPDPDKLATSRISFQQENDPRFDGFPMVLETPESERWAKEIELLRGLT